MSEEILDKVTEVLANEADKCEDVQVLRQIQETGEPTDVTHSVNTTAVIEDQSDIVYEPLPIDPADILELKEINKRIKAGEKFPVFNSLPPKVKDMILEEARKIGISYNDKEQLNTISKIFIDSFISESALDNAFAELQKELNAAFNGDDIVTTMLESRRDQFETKFKELAEKLRPVDEEKAKNLDIMAEAFHTAYSYDKLAEFVDTLPEATKNKLMDDGKLLKRINRTYEDIDYEFSTVGLSFPKMKDFSKMLVIKMRIDPSDIDRFIYLARAYADKNYPMENPGRAIYLFYTFDILKSLSNLSADIAITGQTGVSGFAGEILKNFVSAMDDISEKININHV